MNDLREFHFGDNKDLLNLQNKFSSNYIKTTKFNLITFLPLSCLLQFRQFANIYFLLSAILQFIPQISTLSPTSAIAPLIFVVMLSMVREGIEDIRRYKSDKENNASECIIMVDGQEVKSQWSQIKIGDIIKIENEELIAADCIALLSELDNGQCFIETSSLDGEKNLKPKQAVQLTQNKTIDQISKQFNGKVGCIHPNTSLYSYEGYIEQEGVQQKVPLAAKNLLLRGARLKNVGYVYGLVTYTGKDTKVMKNSGKSRIKMTSIYKKTNKYILVILALQIIFCLSTGLGYVYACNQQTNISIQISDVGNECWGRFFFTVASQFLLLNAMLPISLIVSLEFIKVGQAYFMERDKELYCESNKRSLKVNTVTINEELGQVQYLFTDKTGTLTCNQMEFKMLVVGKEKYGDMNLNTKLSRFLSLIPTRMSTRAREPSHVDARGGVEFCFKDENMNEILRGDKKSKNDPNLKLLSTDGQNQVLYEIKTQRDLIIENLFVLSLCHECILHKEKDGSISYQGPSPDEITLVDFARYMGFKYTGKNNKNLMLNYQMQDQEIELLYLFEFDSDRKRMTIVIKDKGVIKLLTKGADSIIISRLRKDQPQPFLQEINKQLDDFSRKGLRTLCIAIKILTEEQLQQLNKEMQDIVGHVKQDEQIKIIAEKYERDLTLIGCTAVEDRLQDQVPETLRDFLKANVKVWMLTGDKLETAENIGHSCNLIQKDMSVEYLRGAQTPYQLEETMKQFQQKLNKTVQSGYCLMIEGEALTAILELPQLTINFLQIVIFCKSVICCRVTPKQKASVVKLIKDRMDKITMAVGDGANDVNMIQEAHIGIGIYGNEGMRAVQASDYAIGEFKSLWKLVLFHGRLSYIRISECILYFFYKNIVFSICQYYFSFYCLYSGQSIFDDWYITFYNMIFTFCPVVIKALFEQDVYYKQTDNEKEKNSKGQKLTLNQIVRQTHEYSEEEDQIRSFYPNLYYIGQKNHIFKFSRFVKNLIVGFLQGYVCFAVNLYAFSGTISINDKGYTPDIWMVSISMYSSLIILVNLKLALNTQQWTILTWTGLLFTSIGAYIIYIFIANEIKFFVIYQTLDPLVSSPIYYAALFLSCLSMFTLDLVFFSFKIKKQTLLNYVKEHQRRKTTLNPNTAKQLYDKQKLMYRDSIQDMEQRLHSQSKGVKSLKQSLLDNDNSAISELNSSTLSSTVKNEISYNTESESKQIQFSSNENYQLEMTDLSQTRFDNSEQNNDYDDIQQRQQEQQQRQHLMSLQTVRESLREQSNTNSSGLNEKKRDISNSDIFCSNLTDSDGNLNRQSTKVSVVRQSQKSNLQLVKEEQEINEYSSIQQQNQDNNKEQNNQNINNNEQYIKQIDNDILNQDIEKNQQSLNISIDINESDRKLNQNNFSEFNDNDQL